MLDFSHQLLLALTRFSLKSQEQKPVNLPMSERLLEKKSHSLIDSKTHDRVEQTDPHDGSVIGMHPELFVLPRSITSEIVLGFPYLSFKCITMYWH